MVDVLLAILYPPACPLCGRPQRKPGRARLCSPCRGALGVVRAPCLHCAEPAGAPLCRRCARRRPPLERVQAAGVYAPGSPLVEAIGRWKYHGDGALGEALMTHFAQTIRPPEKPADLLVPVPLHRTKLRQRGFNQAALLASALAATDSRFGLYTPDLLRRRPTDQRQAKLNRRDRASHVRDAFFCHRRIGPVRVLLVDDVMTSGETTRACARSLLAAGAAVVEAAVLARTPGSP